MRITNEAGLPAPLYNAIRGHNHRAADYSATQLLKSPRQLALERRHDDEIVVDAAEQVWALYGTMMHAVIEAGSSANELAENYMTHEVDGVTVSGTADLYHIETKKITDYKTTSVFTVLYDSRREEWTQQLNIYAWLMRRHGYEVDGLEIVAILRDWSKTKARFESDYPSHSVVVIPIDLWSDEDADWFVRRRVQLHESVKDVDDKMLPSCSDEYRWKDPDKYAVMKRGNKRAKKLHESYMEAQKHAEESGPDHYVEHRPSVARRCAEYCPAADFCNQWQAEVNQ